MAVVRGLAANEEDYLFKVWQADGECSVADLPREFAIMSIESFYPTAATGFYRPYIIWKCLIFR